MLELTVLSNQDKEYLKDTAIEIKLIVKQTSQNIIDIGNKLKEAKARVGHGHFLTWVKDNFEWSETQARIFIKIADKFGNRDTYHVLDYGTNVLRLLSQDNTSQEAIAEVLTSPVIKTVSEVKEIIKRHKLIEPLQDKVDKGILPKSMAQSLEKLEAIDQMVIWNSTDLVNKEAQNKLRQEIEKLQEELESKEDIDTTEFESLKAEKAKLEAQVTELSKANTEKVELEKKLKELRKNQEKTIKEGVNQELNKLEKEIKEKDSHLNVVQGRIDVLTKTMQCLEKEAGDMEAYKDAYKKIRDSLYNISITLTDVFLDNVMPEEMQKDFIKLSNEMQNGANIFRQSLEKIGVLNYAITE